MKHWWITRDDSVCLAPAINTWRRAASRHVLALMPTSALWTAPPPPINTHNPPNKQYIYVYPIPSLLFFPIPHLTTNSCFCLGLLFSALIMFMLLSLICCCSHSSSSCCSLVFELLFLLLCPFVFLLLGHLFMLLFMLISLLLFPFLSFSFYPQFCFLFLYPT